MSYIPVHKDIAPEVTRALLDLAKETEKLIRVDVALLHGYDAMHETEEMSDEAQYIANSMMFARAVDNFQTFLVDLLLIVFDEHPHSFFKKKIDISRVFEAGSIETLRREAIEREIGSLSYKNLSDLNGFVKSSTGCLLFSNNLMLSRVAHLINLRNVIVHSRGIVSTVSKDRLPHRNYVLGERVTHPSAFKAMTYLFHCGKHVDLSVTKHFTLPAGCLYINGAKSV
ncbi:hypothetical protein BA950_15375 [Erythrobacter sp. SAORIC-644]|uniref:hypothetical protein n=1 Tax=Erythrobacter sp. SAORIC-644 TaxID=1869314 RepID=UPI000C9FA754|nr:hypothetical protein [Erythrobacter sp. SAORIC-644]PNQ74159.1 hypothetical protein BA950_15375 [Erythrobacter sp. SAORIC-644]